MDSLQVDSLTLAVNNCTASVATLTGSLWVFAGLICGVWAISTALKYILRGQ